GERPRASRSTRTRSAAWGRGRVLLHPLRRAARSLPTGSFPPAARSRSSDSSTLRVKFHVEDGALSAPQAKPLALAQVAGRGDGEAVGPCRQLEGEAPAAVGPHLAIDPLHTHRRPQR